MQPYFRLRGSRILPLLLVLFVALANCAEPVVTSTLVLPDHLAHRSHREGMSYFLPRRLVKITLSRTEIESKDIAKEQEAITKASKAIGNLEKEKKKAEEEAAAYKTRLAAAIAAKAGQPARDFLQAEQEKAEARSVVAKAEIKTTKKAIAEKTEFLRNLKAGLGKMLETATIEELPLEPDPNWMFVAQLDHRMNREDDIKLKVVNGLLNSSDVDSTDKSVEIITDLVRSVAAISGRIPLPSLKTDIPEVPKEDAIPECRPYKTEVILDPTDVCATEKFLGNFTNRQHAAAIVPMDWNGNPLTCSKSYDAFRVSRYIGDSPFATQDDASKPSFIKVDGYAYRRPLPYLIEVTPKDTACDGKDVRRQKVLAKVTAPNRSAINVLPMRAGRFTQTVIGSTFKDGMPEAYNVNRPSEVAAVAGLPVDIAKALISIPTQMLQLRVNYNSEDTALIEAQKNALDAEIDLIEARQRYEEAKKAAQEEPE